MRGFFEAAALLFSPLASAYVLPDPTVLNVRPASAVVDYAPDDASLKFAINTVDQAWGFPILTFQVQGSDKACGDSHVTLNGQSLQTRWDGISAQGSDFLDVYGGLIASWNVTCLYDVTPPDGSNSDGQDVIHLLVLQFDNPEDRPDVPSFTISYKQISKPAIIRFIPSYIEWLSDAEMSLWSEPSADFNLDNFPSTLEGDSASHIEQNFQDYGQKNLGAKIKALTASFGEKVHKTFEKIGKKLPCHKIWHAVKPKRPAKPEIPSPPVQPEAPSQPVEYELPEEVHRLSAGWPHAENDSPPTEHDELDAEYLDSDDNPSSIQHDEEVPSAVSNTAAAQTRSLEHTYANSISQPSFSIAEYTPDLVVVKSLGLALVLFSFVAWIIIRCKDPRRRADRAAAREERRTKRLYRQAARVQKLRTWVWDLRLKYGLASDEAISWDEKRSRVIEQEAVLEGVIKNDIRALRNAHRVESNITAAEEGRNAFAYETDASERRRSVSTLPGYESEEFQPPSYEGTTAVDGFRYTLAAEREFTPDSSVISTSPRISRDGTNSDFDEKFEPINLGEARGV